MATVNVNISTLDADDRRAARMIVGQKNAEIAAQNANIVFVNQQRAQNVPPLDPIADTPLLLTSTTAELKASYEPLLAAIALGVHTSHVAQATEQAATSSALFQTMKAAFADANLAKQQAAIAALA
jgi:hypothetical protein